MGWSHGGRPLMLYFAVFTCGYIIGVMTCLFVVERKHDILRNS